MKYLIFLITLAATLNAKLPDSADEITLEYLAKVGEESGYCDHAIHIQKIFENAKIKTMLEFGLGLSTKVFLDSCNKVISVEFLTPYNKGDWLKYTLALYEDYSNWVPVAFFSSFSGDYSWVPYKFFGTTKFFEAEIACMNMKQPPRDEACLKELQTFIGNLTKYNKVDLALVDPGSLLRGLLIQLLFDKCPIILAHDCNSYVNEAVEDIYGYRKIEVPENYETIFIPKGKQTLLWIEKKQENMALIQLMKEYAEAP